MTVDHWFDVLSKSASRAANRRAVAHPLAGLVSGLFLSGLTGLGSAKNKSKKRRGKGKGKKKGKGKGNGGKGNNHKPNKPKPPRPPRPPDVCDTTWPGTDDEAAHNREYCRFIRRQCDGDDPREFCIVDGHFGDPPWETMAAVCCNEGEVCCVDTCCEKGGVCCGTECCDAKKGEVCCQGACCDVSRNGSDLCCDGVCSARNDPATCGSCDHSCYEGEVCCAGRCLDPSVYVCCPDGSACPAQTHVCVALPSPNPDDQPTYGCGGKDTP